MTLSVPEMASQDGVKFISGLLADNGVPSALWGEFFLNVYGVPSILSVSSYVLYSLRVWYLMGTSGRRFRDT